MSDDREYTDRRSIDSRLGRAETAIIALDKRLSLAERDVSQLVLTVQSRYEALNGGITALLARMERLVPSESIHNWRAEMMEMGDRTASLEKTRDQMDGALALIKFFGVANIIAWAVVIIKLFVKP